MDDYIPPSLDATRFTCPHCARTARHVWKDHEAGPATASFPVVQFATSICAECNGIAVWRGADMVHPAKQIPAYVECGLPERAREHVRQARLIYHASPAACGALLRLALLELCLALDGAGPGTVGNDLHAAWVRVRQRHGLPATMHLLYQATCVVSGTPVTAGAIVPSESDLDARATADGLIALLRDLATFA